MRHSIPVGELSAELGPRAAAMAGAVFRCVHCGFCLATCPTYLALGEEMDSPRGRILLMKEVLEGALDLDDALTHIDPCLGCLACETSCPSGVEYGQLLQPFRARGERRRRWSRLRRLRRSLLLGTLSSPRRLRVVGRLGQALRPLRKALPSRLAAPLELLPRSFEPAFPLPRRSPAVGPRRARVALLAGCAQQVLAPDIHRATLDVLTRNGVEVVVPRGQGCCGALALHAGDEVRARRLLRRTLDALSAALDEVDALVTNAAGCGSGLVEGARLLGGSAREGAAQELAERTRDASAFLDELGLSEEPPPLARPLRVVYQDACHLLHAQRVREPPRRLLRQIPGVELAEIAEAEVCCGSAGTYNLEHPQIAAELGARKAERILRAGAQLVASGNVGCLSQIAAHLKRQRSGVPVRHTLQVLRDAYHGTLGDL